MSARMAPAFGQVSSLTTSALERSSCRGRECSSGRRARAPQALRGSVVLAYCIRRSSIGKRSSRGWSAGSQSLPPPAAQDGAPVRGHIPSFRGLFLRSTRRRSELQLDLTMMTMIRFQRTVEARDRNASLSRSFSLTGCRLTLAEGPPSLEADYVPERPKRTSC